MDEEFDTSIDTSSFDDITPDTSNVGSIYDASDIVNVMDEGMAPGSFDSPEELDSSFADTSNDIGKMMDEVPSDIPSNGVAVISTEQPEFEDVSSDAKVDNPELMNEGETYYLPHGEFSRVESDSLESDESSIEDLMNETKPVIENTEVTAWGEGETPDLLNDKVDSDISESGNIDTADISGPGLPNDSEDVDAEAAILDASEGNDNPEASSYDRLYEYITSHNYGKGEFAVYSKDSEWQELNNAYRVDLGMDPIDYGNSEEQYLKDMSDQITEGWGIPADSPEYAAIMKNEQDGLSNINNELNDSQIDSAPSEGIENVDNDIPQISENDEMVEIEPIEQLDGWLKEINPNFDAYDIESPYSNNCGSCAYAVYRKLEGDSGICATADNIGQNSEMEELTGMEQVSMNPADIEQRLLEQGAGSHAIIGIDRAEGPGHWFNAANIDGKIVAIDGQDGTISDWPPDYGDVVNWEMSIGKEI